MSNNNCWQGCPHPGCGAELWPLLSDEDKCPNCGRVLGEGPNEHEREIEQLRFDLAHMPYGCTESLRRFLSDVIDKLEKLGR